MWNKITAFMSGAKKRCGKFSGFLWNSDTLGEVSIDFFSEIESCFNETPYRVTRRRHFKTNKQTNESGLEDPYSSKKSRLVQNTRLRDAYNRKKNVTARRT